MQITIVVGLIMNEKKEVLMAKRSDPNLPEADNRWEFVGGKIEFGENPATAVVREALEETGLEVEVVRFLPKVFTNLWKKRDGEEFQVFVLCYECKIVGGKMHEGSFDHKILELKFEKPENIRNYPTLKNVNEITEFFINYK